MAKNVKTCAYKGCDKPVPSERHKYCSDAHRRYAYKKRHWAKYLAWQRKYSKQKRKEKRAQMIASAE